MQDADFLLTSCQLNGPPSLESPSIAACFSSGLSLVAKKRETVAAVDLLARTDSGDGDFIKIETSILFNFFFKLFPL